MCLIGDTSSNGGFSIIVFVFGGVWYVLPKDWFTVDPMKVKCLKVPTGKICDDYVFPL